MLLQEADLIVLGPGSLYTSVISNLCIEGISKAIISSQAPKLYISNIMTQPGETNDYDVYDKLLKLFINMLVNHLLIMLFVVMMHLMNRFFNDIKNVMLIL